MPSPGPTPRDRYIGTEPYRATTGRSSILNRGSPRSTVDPTGAIQVSVPVPTALIGVGSPYPSVPDTVLVSTSVVLVTSALAGGSAGPAGGRSAVDLQASTNPPAAPPMTITAAAVARSLRLINAHRRPAASPGRPPMQRHRLGRPPRGRSLATAPRRPDRGNRAGRCPACTERTRASAPRWLGRSVRVRPLAPGRGTCPRRQGTLCRPAARRRRQAVARWRPGRESHVRRWPACTGRTATPRPADPRTPGRRSMATRRLRERTQQGGPSKARPTPWPTPEPMAD